MSTDDTPFYLFFYTIPTHPFDVWIVHGGQFHRFVWLGQGYRYVRTSSYLPGGAEGTAYEFQRAAAEALHAEAARWGVRLTFSRDLRTCLTAAARQDGPMVFGLEQPAAALSLHPARG